MNRRRHSWFNECLREGFEMLSDDDPADRRPDVEDPPVDELQEALYDEWAHPELYEDD